MLVAPGLSKRRMALVAIDNLAELALYRHKRGLAQAAQESWRDVEPRLDNTDEQRFRSNFNVRVELGLKGAGRGCSRMCTSRYWMASTPGCFGLAISTATAHITPTITTPRRSIS